VIKEMREGSGSFRKRSKDRKGRKNREESLKEEGGKFPINDLTREHKISRKKFIWVAAKKNDVGKERTFSYRGRLLGRNTTKRQRGGGFFKKRESCTGWREI